MDNVFQKGIPLTIAWNLTKPDGTAFDLNGYAHRMFYTVGNRHKEVSGTSVSGNVISWVFPANEQTAAGDYTMTLMIYQNGSLFCKLTYANAFSLFHGSAAGGNSSQQQQTSNVVNLYSAAEYYLFQPVVPVVGDDGFWYVNGVRISDGSGNYIPSYYGVKYAPTTKWLYIYKGDPDVAGNPVVEIIKDIAVAFAAWQAEETARMKAEGQLGSGDPDYQSSRIRQEEIRQANEAVRQRNEGTKNGSAPGDGSRWGDFKQAQVDRAAAYAEEEGTQAGSSAGDGSRWGDYKTAEAARDTARETVEGTASSVAGDGTRWGTMKAVEGTASSEAGDGSRWGAYKTAEANRDTARANAEGTAFSTAGDGTRWGEYKSAEAARDAARFAAEGTASSEAGDGTRWGAFKTNESARNNAMAPLVGSYVCETAAATAAKTVAATGYVLGGGGAFKVKFTYANTAASPTLNVNSTGAKAIVFNGAVASASNSWGAGEVVEFYYDPTYDSNAGAFIGRSTVISVSQNTETGHAEINIGGVANPVASVDEVSQLGQQVLPLFLNVDKSYNDSNGNMVSYPGFSCTGKLIYGDDVTIVSNKTHSRQIFTEVLFWENDTYLGASGSNLHAYPNATHFAFIVLNSSLSSDEQLFAVFGMIYRFFKSSVTGNYVCNSLASAENKEVSIDGFVLSNNVLLIIKMQYATTVSGTNYLSINGLRRGLNYNGSRANALNTWADNAILLVWYDETLADFNSIDLPMLSNSRGASKTKTLSQFALENEFERLDRIDENLYFEDVVVSNETYNDVTGAVVSYSGRSRTNKLKYNPDAQLNVGLEDYGEALFWNGDTYQGYSTTSIVSPYENTTHIAFCWAAIKTNVRYSYIPTIDEVLSLFAHVYTKTESDARFASEEDMVGAKSDISTLQGNTTTQGQKLNSLEGDVESNTNNISSINSRLTSINGEVETIQDTIGTINDVLSDLASPLPSGAIAGDNVWTGENTFAQSVVGVPAQADNEFATLGQVKNANHKFVDAEDFGFSPLASATDNATALNNAIGDGGKTITISKPGTYMIGDTIILKDDTEIVCGSGVIIKKANATFSAMFRNVGAEERITNKNIVLRNLHLSINGFDGAPNTDSAIFGLRGVISLLCVENVLIDNYTIDDLAGHLYGVHINTFSNFTIQNSHISGNKDGIHMSDGNHFIIRNCVLNTADDGIALNSSDWGSSNCVDGTLSYGHIEDIKSSGSGRLLMLLGAFVDWFDGMEIKRGDRVVSNGRVYRALTDAPDGQTYTSHTEPTITTFTGRQADSGGFYWKLMKDSVFYQTNVENITIRNWHSLSTRIVVQVDNGNWTNWNRSLYPTVPASGHPHVSNIVVEDCDFETVIFENNRGGEDAFEDIAFIRCRMPNTSFGYGSKNIDIYGSLILDNCDFSRQKELAYQIYQGQRTSINIINAKGVDYIKFHSDEADGRLQSNYPVGDNTRVYRPIKGDIIKREDGTPVIYNGTSWVSML